MGFFDRFRRSSKPEPEPEKPAPRSSEPGRSSLGTDKLTRGSFREISQPEQELLDAIAAIWDDDQSDLIDDEPSANPPFDQEVDLAKTVSLLMGETPEPQEDDDESESTYEQDVNAAIDTIVGLMREMPEMAELREDIRKYAEKQAAEKADSEPPAEPEPEPEPIPFDEPMDDLLSSIAALMEKPAQEPEPEPALDTPEELEPASDENPFSAIAELMGQGAADPKPQDDPMPGEDDDNSEDLLKSIAALMGESMYATDRHEVEPPAAPEIDPDLMERFTELCTEGERALDEGALETAIAMYLQASVFCEESAALKGMALHHAATLLFHQVGDGFSAANFARDSLECGEEFRAYAQEHVADGQPNAHMESLQIAALTAASYDEALEYADQGVGLYGEEFGSMADDLRQYRIEHPRFADFQRNESLKHYSRASAEEDAGDYAPAMALMDIMLRNAEEDAYDLSYEEQARIMDDLGTISIMHMLGKARSLGLSQGDFALELSFIADSALYRLADFQPICQPADKQNLERIIQGMKMLPGVSSRPAFEPFK